MQPSRRSRCTLTALVACAGAGLFAGMALIGAVTLVPVAVADPTVLLRCLAMLVPGAALGAAVARATRRRVFTEVPRRRFWFALATAVGFALWAPLVHVSDTWDQDTADGLFMVPLLLGIATAAAYSWSRRNPAAAAQWLHRDDPLEQRPVRGNPSPGPRPETATPRHAPVR